MRFSSSDGSHRVSTLSINYSSTLPKAIGSQLDQLDQLVTRESHTFSPVNNAREAYESKAQKPAGPDPIKAQDPGAGSSIRTINPSANSSGFKRTFKIKDFGHSIPGHGGITDRMDCQFIMGFFAYIYYHAFIAVYKVKLGTVIETAITGLTPDEQIKLVKGMSRYLSNQGIVTEGFLVCIDKAGLNGSS
ncbi:hypothetical protein DL767_009601 [Monosporascus sp. MG133]|nr:hypothetical protein DL767_009601 [Monosporascus sp. MG133]